MMMMICIAHTFLCIHSYSSTPMHVYIHVYINATDQISVFLARDEVLLLLLLSAKMARGSLQERLAGRSVVLLMGVYRLKLVLINLLLGANC